MIDRDWDEASAWMGLTAEDWADEDDPSQRAGRWPPVPAEDTWLEVGAPYLAHGERPLPAPLFGTDDARDALHLLSG